MRWQPMLIVRFQQLQAIRLADRFRYELQCAMLPNSIFNGFELRPLAVNQGQDESEWDAPNAPQMADLPLHGFALADLCCYPLARKSVVLLFLQPDTGYFKMDLVNLGSLNSLHAGTAIKQSFYSLIL